MKDHFSVISIAACVAVAAAAPSIALAQQTSVAQPPAKAPASPPSGNLEMRASGLMSQGSMARTLMAPSAAQIADQEVCLFQNANFGGWKFCTNLKGLQTLPSRYIGQTTSMRVPDGYLLRLYQREDRTGVQCVFYGQVGQVSRDCDNMTAAISFETDPEWPAKQAAAQRQRDLEEAEAARQQQRAERDAEAARAAAFAQREREAAQARAQAIIDRDRGVQEARNAEQAQKRAARDESLARMYGCLIYVKESDGGEFARWGGAETRCFDVSSTAYVGNDWNDDIEMIRVENPYIVFIGYEHANFQGRSVRLTCGQYELTGDPEDEISSVRVELLENPITCKTGPTLMVRSWDR
jgi:hypothetical protein